MLVELIMAGVVGEIWDNDPTRLSVSHSILR